MKIREIVACSAGHMELLIISFNRRGIIFVDYINYNIFSFLQKYFSYEILRISLILFIQWLLEYFRVSMDHDDA